MIAQKTLRIFVALALLIALFLGANALVVRGERNHCHAWQDYPELWVDWRIKQCEQVGVPLPVSR